MLHTRTSYLHKGILDYVAGLTDTFDVPFDTAILTCTRSGVNSNALCIVKAMTGKRGSVAMGATYHGNTAVSSYLSRIVPPREVFIIGHRSIASSL